VLSLLRFDWAVDEQVAAIGEDEHDALVSRRNLIEQRKESIEKRQAILAEKLAIMLEEDEKVRHGG